MPFLTTEIETDEHGVVKPKGVRERVDLITNPLATPNRTIPMAMIEGSVTFILDRTRKHAATLPFNEARDFIFDIIRILNPKQEKELRVIYDDLDEKGKKDFIKDCISLNRDGTLRTDNGIYIRWEAFTEGSSMRDQIIEVYEKYPDIFKPYHVFMPKPKWGKELYIGDNPVGYQYIITLKQSSTSQFSVRPSGSIGDEGMPEKSRTNKTSKAPWSQKPINVKLVGVKLL